MSGAVMEFADLDALATNFTFPPLVDFLKQADTLARKQQGNKR